MASESALDLYNKLLGNRRGKPIRRATSSPAATRQSGRTNRITVARARPSSNYNRVLSGGTGRARRSGRGLGAGQISNTWQDTVDRLLTEYRTRSAETETLNRINQAQAEEDEDRPWWQDIQNAVGLVNPLSNEGFSSSVIGRALDLVSRPAYGLAEGLTRVGGQETHRGFSGGDIAHTLGNLFSGFGSGFTGQDKTGFGQAYEAVKENEASDVGSGLRAFEEAHPLLEQRMAQGLGFAGELFLDPLNRFTPARMNVTADGALATSDVMRRTMDDVVRNVTADMAAGTAIPSWMANPQRMMDNVANQVAQSVDNTLLEVTGGGKKMSRLNRRGFSDQASASAAARLREGINAPVRDLIERFRHPFQGSVKRSFTWQKLEHALRNNQDFGQFYTDLVARLEADPNISFPTGLTPREVFDQVINRPSIAASRHWDEAMEDILAKYDTEVESFRDELGSQFTDAVYPTLGVNFYGKNIPVKGIGRAYRNVSRRLDGHGPFGRGIFDNLNISHQLPDRVALFSSRARSGRHTGIDSLNDFNKTLKTFFRRYSADEMDTLGDYLDRGVQTVGNPHMDDALQFIRDNYEKIRQIEVQWGVRNVDDIADNYNFLFNRGGTKKARTEFKNNRKAAFKDSNVQGAGPYGIQAAKDAGLKPVTHAGENLFRRYEKMQRDVTKQALLKDLVHNYGLQMDELTPAMMKKLGLKEVPTNKLDLARQTGLRGQYGKADQKMYLPESMYSGSKGQKGGINGYYENFDEMLSWSPQNSGQFTRNFSKIINMIKFLQTVPNPGFHMRNMMGDIAMGLMDDINPMDYARTIKKYLAHKAKKTAQSTFDIIPGIKLTWDEAVKLFRENADTGFFSVDTKKFQSRTAGNIPRDLARGTANNLRKASDIREEMGRFVHFITAYQDEARALYKKGRTNLSVDQIARQAEDAALWRVNAYKFDYGALTPFEKQAKSVAFPFMTYTRKAMPLLLEQLYSNPQFLSMAGRFMEYNDGSGSDAFNALNIPQYIKDMGFGMVSDGEEPSYINADMLNLGSLSLLGKVGPQDLLPGGEGPGDFFRGVLSQLNPLAAAPIELGTGRDLYFDKPLQGNYLDYIASQVPLLGDVQSEAGVNIPGIPGEVGFENPITARLLGLNVGPKKISIAQQEQQHEANLDQAIESPLKQFNYSQDQYSIYQRLNDQGQMEFVLNNKMTGDELATAATPAELIEYAQQQPGADFQAPDFTGRNRPTYADVMARLGQS